MLFRSSLKISSCEVRRVEQDICHRRSTRRTADFDSCNNQDLQVKGVTKNMNNWLADTSYVPARPSLVINKTREPVRQVLNSERQSDLGIELVPADDFGDLGETISEDEIYLREGLVRRIQRESKAADARTWAFNRAAIAGRGYWRVNTRYVPGKTNDQEIYIHRWYNQSCVTLDPAHEQPDGSDAEWAFVGTDMPWDQYKAEYPLRNGKIGRAHV